MNLDRTTLDLIPNSICNADGLECGMARIDGEKKLILLGKDIPDGFHGERTESNGSVLCVCPQSPGNAAALRNLCNWLQPRPLGLRTSIGMGDRLGLATPGHVRAVRATGARIAPIFAQ